ncbi:unnamed protein product [Arabidopsis halleri]
MEKCGDVDDCISTTEAAELAAKPEEYSATAWTSGFHQRRVSMPRRTKHKYRQIGNAVHPPLAFALCRKLKEALYLNSSLQHEP